MPLYTAEALVLRTYKLAESDLIVVFLTRDRGKKRGVAKSARQSRKRFGAALEPLTHARVAYFEKERRELVSLNYAEPITSPLAAGSAESLTYVSYFAELIDEWAQESDADERLFRLGTSVLQALGAQVSVEPLARYFEYWLLRLQGVYPSHLACHACGVALSDGHDAGAYLAIGAAVFTCQHCAPALDRGGDGPGRMLSRGALAFLAAARGLTPLEVGDYPLPSGVARELEGVHRALIALHLEKTLRSDRVLREMRR